MLYPLLLVGLCAFLFSIVLTPVCRNLFRRLGIVDRPDHQRKLHTEAVPHMGGVPIAIAYVASCLLLTLFPRTDLPIHWLHVLRAAPAGLIIFATGVLDDILHLKPWQKLCGQLLGALWAYWAGVRIGSIAGYEVGWASLLVTVIWLIGCTNAFNLIDGVDGLASGVGLFATATMLIAALLHDNTLLAMATAPLAGALLGFLRYNFNPASIFLGDSGSLMIGFLLGSFGVVWGQKSATILGMTAPLMALGIPLLDAGLSIVRRFLRHQPIFGADRGHIHHRLLDRGFTPRRVALVLYGVAGVAALLSLLQSVVTSNQIAGVVIVLFGAAAWIGIQHLGYTEFGTARRMLFAGTFQQALDTQLRLRSLEQELLAAKSIQAYWEHILDAARTFDFVEVRLSIADTIYQKRLQNTHSDLCWSLRVPLPGIGYINFTRPHESAVFSMGVSSFIDVVRKTMSAKSREFGVDEPLKVVTAGTRLD
jgi:UDP-GlcNAc:undecaprenyl-phosphate GlcNAc-1-phosphate transferase